MAVRQSGFTRASALGPIADFIDRQGGSISRVLQDVDLPFTLLENPDMLVPLKEQFRLLHRAARETGDPHFGARLGQNVRIKNLSAFGKWVSDAQDLEGAIERSRQGLNVFLQTATVLKLEQHGEMSRWSIEFLDPASDGRYQNELLGLGYLIDAVRCFAGRSWIPGHIATTSTKAHHIGSLEQLYKTNVSTGNKASAIEIPTHLLAARGGLTGMMGGAPPRELESEPSVPPALDDHEAIIAVTMLALLEGYPRIDWVAGKLGLTRRSFQRRLEEQGTTFTRLLGEVLRERSKALVAQTSEPITEIALKLGYTDSAHFTRAFKKWTGVAPSVYRRMQS